MAPTLALLLCIAGIIGLVILDVRRDEPVSSSLWIALLWVLYCGSRPLSYWFSPGLPQSTNLEAAGGSAVDRAFLSFLIFLALIVLFRRRVDWGRIVAENRWTIALFGFMLASVLWSDYPDISFKRWARTSGDLVMALLVLTEAEPGIAMRTLFRRSAYILLPLSIVLIKYFRDIGVAYTEDGGMTMWVGVTTHKNVLGYTAMVCGLFCMDGVFARGKARKKLPELLMLGAAIWLMLGSSTASSKTSLIGFSLGAALLAVLGIITGANGRLRRYWPILAILLVAAALSFLLCSDALFESAVHVAGRDATLTGRTEIWQAVLAIGPGNRLVGRAYGSFWMGDREKRLWRRFFDGLHQAHNGYIDVYVELGIVGLVILASITLSSFGSLLRQLFRTPHDTVLRLVFLVLILVHNITESSFGRPNHLLWFLFLLVTVTVGAKRSQRILTAASPSTQVKQPLRGAPRPQPEFPGTGLGFSAR